MPYARTDDRVRIYYEAHGRGFPLVLAYGIGGNTQMWDTNIEALSARYRLILWDRKAHVGGLSMGGGIATRFTLLYPRRVAALVVTNSSSAVGLPLSPDNLVMRAQSIKVTLEQGMDAMTEFAMRANPNVAGRLALDPNAKAEFYAEYRALTPIGYANALRALIAMDHITDRLSTIRAPTLLIGGDQDPSLAPMKVMHRKVKGSKMVVLSPAGHFGNRDRPEAWNRTVLDFLGRVDAKRR